MHDKFFTFKLYNRWPISIRKLDASSYFKVTLRRHFLWYSYLVIVHACMYFISTSKFSGLSFFLNIHYFAAYLFLQLISFSGATICILLLVTILCFKLMACYTRVCLYSSRFLSFAFWINFLNFLLFNIYTFLFFVFVFVFVFLFFLWGWGGVGGPFWLVETFL